MVTYANFPFECEVETRIGKIFKYNLFEIKLKQKYNSSFHLNSSSTFRMQTNGSQMARYVNIKC